MDGKKSVEVACGVIYDSSLRLLAAERPADKPLAGFWEFPGGKLEAGESAQTALVRELREELDLAVTVFDEMYRIEAKTGDGRPLILHFIRAFVQPGSEPRACEKQRFKWLKSDEIASVPWLVTDKEFVDFLRS